jgi:UDP:flavonoid glycosyltransferase YjiC (YdhE family)
MHRKRILFVAEAATLAHVTRLLVLAKALPPEDYEVHFACARFDPFIFGEEGFRRWPIYSAPADRFLRSVARGTRLFDTPTLTRYVEEDLRLLAEVRPDVVVGDFRVSLAVSAPVSGVPYVLLTNAHYSPWAQVPLPPPEIPLTRLLGVKVSQWLLRHGEGLISWYFARPIEKLRRRYGLPAGGGLREMFSCADHTLYADVPGLVPTPGAPGSHEYIGPVLWQPQMDLPAWWNSLPPRKPCVYVTLGSSGWSRLVPLVLQSLTQMDVCVLLATAGRSNTASLSKSVYAAEFLPGLEAAARSNLVVCNGGSATAYQALAAGVPVLGIGANMDQLLTMEYIERAGAGTLLRAGHVSSASFQRAASALLEDPSYKSGAAVVAKEMGQYDAASRFRSFLRSCLG